VQSYRVELECLAPRTYRTQRAADSVNLNIEEKSRHLLEVAADFDSPFNVGVVVGSSGSGKTTLAKSVWGDDCARDILDPARPVIDQFPEEMAYDECVEALTGVGLTSIPCWIRPAYTLSNGQRARAEAALKCAIGARAGGVVVLDEWTSVVDRTVAQVMSARISKYFRSAGKRIVLLTPHYDVISWLEPDWIVDCNTQTYEKKKTTSDQSSPSICASATVARGVTLVSITI
jgi:ABC-type ATPase with predicted acetyltransferase domain